MNGVSCTLLYGVLIAAGVGIPIMAALNAGLGTRLGNPVLAATFFFGLALLSSLGALWLSPRPINVDLFAVPPRFFLGGFLIVFYVLAVTIIAPRIGVGNAIIFVLFGQLLAAAAIDHFGWLGAAQSSLSWSRCAGILLVAGGTVLARQSAVAG